MSSGASGVTGTGTAPAQLSFEDQAQEIAGAIGNASSVAILTHARADADAIGSTIGFAFLCRALRVEPALVTTGDFTFPDNLKFMDPGGWFKPELDNEAIQSDLIAYIDCAEDSRASPASEKLLSVNSKHRQTINIDHHITNTNFATINLVQPDAASTAEILVGLFRTLEIPISSELATALLAGIYGDTLGLKTPSTKPTTMRACAALIESGAHLDLVVDRLFREKPYSTVLLWGEAQLRSAWSGRLIWTHVDQELLERTGAANTETEGLVNFLAGTHGAFAAAVAQESDNGWRVSLRSTTEAVDVSALAQRFGGGGHPRAAGCQIPPGRSALEEFIQDISAQLDLLPEDAGSREPHAAPIRS